MVLFHYAVFKKLISDYNCEKNESNKVNSNDKLNYKEKNVPGKFFINSKTKQNLNRALSGNKNGQLPREKLYQVDFSNESKIENPIEIFFSPRKQQAIFDKSKYVFGFFEISSRHTFLPSTVQTFSNPKVSIALCRNSILLTVKLLVIEIPVP